MNTRPQIIFPYVGDSVGGSQLSSLLLINELQVLGYDTKILVHDVDGPLAKYLSMKEIQFTSFPLKKAIERTGNLSLLFLRALQNFQVTRRYLTKFSTVVVHTNDIRMNLMWALATRGKCKHIWHQRTAIGRPWLWRFVPLLTDKIIAISRYIELDIQSRKVLQVYNPFLYLKPNRNCARIRLSDFVKTDLNSKVVIGYVGRIEYSKGIDVFAEALPSNENIEAIVIGSGSAEKLLYNVDCHFLGFLDNAIKYISGIDIVVVPSRSEGFGRIVLEASMQGCKVVASDIPAHREIESFGAQIEFFKVGDANECRQAILKLMKTPPSGVWDKNLAKFFSPKKHAKILGQIYDELTR